MLTTKEEPCSSTEAVAMAISIAESSPLRPPPASNSHQKLGQLQAEWTDSYKKSMEKALVEVTETLHQEFLTDRQKIYADLAAQYQLQEEAMKARVYKSAEVELQTKVSLIEKKHRAAVYQTKRQEWCTTCQDEAIYPCCWNTNYCSKECQLKDWKTHRSVCRRRRNE